MSVAANLVLVGASTRAAAFSALRAGFRPWCADLFADLDLQARCPVRVVAGRDYPHGILDAVRTAPAVPLLYTGALENQPALVDRLARLRPLWGNSAAVLRRVRVPGIVSAVLSQHGLPHPDVVGPADPLPRAGRWLLKPVRGAGGAGIDVWDGAPLPSRAGTAYLQQYLEGESCAAVYVGQQQGTELLGVTRQLTGATWLHAAPFHYCGSIGPLILTGFQQAAFTRLGDVLARAFNLRGLFGVDCILCAGVPYPVEVNPRYTASVEVLEYATGMAALNRHHAVFDPSTLLRRAEPLATAGAVIGKAVYFAPHDVVLPADGPWRSAVQAPAPVENLPTFADVPAAGQRIPAGRPVMTFFAGAANLSECLTLLRIVAADLDSRLERT